MLIRIKNGVRSKQRGVFVLYKKQNITILNFLYKEGFINGFFMTKNNLIYVKLKYYQNEHVFNSYKRLSVPGRRRYYSVDKLVANFYHKPFVVVSTSKGLMLHKYAIAAHIGGEVWFELNYC